MLDSELDSELDHLPRLIADAGEPLPDLPDIDDPAFGELFDRFGEGEQRPGEDETYPFGLQ